MGEGEGGTRHPFTRRRGSWRRECHLAGDREEETEQDPKGTEEGEEEDGDTPWGAPVKVTRVGGDGTPPEENSDLLGFTP